MRQFMVTALAVGLVGVSAGCGLVRTDEPGPVTESSPSAPASPAAPGGSPPPGEVVSVDREWHGARVHFDVRPVEVDDGLAVLRYDFSATSDDSSGPPELWTVVMNLGGLGNSVTDGRGVRLFDTGAGLVHPVAQAPGDVPAAEIDWVEDGTLQGSAVAVFAAPVNESVDVLFPGFGAVTLPVVAAGDDFQDAVDQVGGVSDAETKELRAFTHAYDARSSTSAEDGAVTVTLASDVLFASDEHTLSRQARNVVDRAAASIRKQADTGEVHVVGHTDDVDSAAYNQALSERRAASVAGRLRTKLGDSFTVTEEGRGKREPVAEGTSDEARAANRRVEIEFQGHLVVDAADAERGALGTDVPTAKNGAVTIATDDSGYSEYTVEVESMVRRPGAIVGTLVAERTKGTSLDPAWFLPSYLTQIGNRDFGALGELAGPHNLSLLGSEERVLPFDYVHEKMPGGFLLRRLLGDEEVKPLERGGSTLITVVWPDTGQDTVTVDAPDRFRITDIPVTDSPTGD